MASGKIGILELPAIPTDDREWNYWLEGLNSRLQITDELSRAVLANSQAEDLKFHLAATSLNRSSAQLSAPLSATDAGTDATVTVAAHTVQLGSTQLSYSAGSVTALAYSTEYFIYADDAGLDGGSVAYAASTSYEDAINSDDRYYVGVITTPAAAAGPTTGGSGAGGGGAGENWLK